MEEWYKKYEYCPLPYLYVGRIREDKLTEFIKEIHFDKFVQLPNVSVDYTGYGLYTIDGKSDSWYLRPNKPLILSGHHGYIKSVKDIVFHKCIDIDAPETFDLLRNFSGLKRVHVACMNSGSYISPHADNPYQEGLKFHISLTDSSTSYYFNGVEFKMELGDIFWLNTGVPHAVINNDSNPRINLIIDTVLNDTLERDIDTLKIKLTDGEYLI